MDETMTPGLGTKLRELLELLDGSVDAIYAVAGLDYRARFTPIVKALDRFGPLSIRQLAELGGMSHPAASQTVQLLVDRALVARVRGQDGRERLVELSERGHQLVPRLKVIWRAADCAADELNDEIGADFGQLIGQVIAALRKRDFQDRIQSYCEAEPVR